LRQTFGSLLEASPFELYNRHKAEARQKQLPLILCGPSRPTACRNARNESIDRSMHTRRALVPRRCGACGSAKPLVGARAGDNSKWLVNAVDR
jgi:hypothetical protein